MVYSSIGTFNVNLGSGVSVSMGPMIALNP